MTGSVEPGRTWALILAAGEGTRLQGLTTDVNGISTPKQFCSLRGGPSLIRQALSRAERICPTSRIVTVVAADHVRWWRAELAGHADGNIIVQPCNRGTAAGLLLPLLEILDRDPDARIVVLASDHYVRDEAVLVASMQRALDGLSRQDEPVTLLGITPDAPEPDYGWIVPSETDGSGTRRVQRFVEKPQADVARQLRWQGGVWNSFLLAARGAELLSMIHRRAPDLVEALEVGRRDDAVAQAYATSRTVDFSRDILEGQQSCLRVLTVPPCGWTDLGTPARVWECVRALPEVTTTTAPLAAFDLWGRVQIWQQA
jgi:mannose-1-phosphate guanylyltransferase